MIGMGNAWCKNGHGDPCGEYGAIIRSKYQSIDIDFDTPVLYISRHYA